MSAERGASWLFFRAFLRSLRFDVSERIDLQGFNSLLGKAIALCKAHSGKADASAKGLLQSAETSTPPQETKIESPQTETIYQGYSASQITGTLEINSVKTNLDPTKGDVQNSQPDNNEGASFSANHFTIVHQQVQHTLVQEIQKAQNTRRPDNNQSKKSQSPSLISLAPLEKNPEVKIVNENDRRNYMVLVDFSPEEESNTSAFRFPDNSILKGLGLSQEENSAGLLRRRLM